MSYEGVTGLSFDFNKYQAASDDNEEEEEEPMVDNEEEEKPLVENEEGVMVDNKAVAKPLANNHGKAHSHRKSRCCENVKVQKYELVEDSDKEDSTDNQDLFEALGLVKQPTNVEEQKEKKHKKTEW